MKIRSTIILGGATLVALAGTAHAVDFDPTMQAGQYETTQAATVVRGTGGNYENVTISVPFILPEDQSLFDATAVQKDPNSDRPLGAVTTFTNDLTNIQAVIALGSSDLAFPMGSNNAFLGEGTQFNRSNAIGTLLPDGTLVWREAFDFNTQNNIGYETIMVEPQTAGMDVGDTAENLLFDTSAPGIGDGTNLNSGFAALGNPGAARDETGQLYVGMTGFDGFEGTIPRGCAVWAAPAMGGVDPNTTVEEWLQDDTTGDLLPSGESANDVRQTQPHLQRVVSPDTGNSQVLALFGVGISGGMNLTGGSADPRYLVIDSATAGDGYAGAIFIEADGAGGNPLTSADINNTNPAFSFIDHQATGGGVGPFVNSQFDMNVNGDVVALWKDESASIDVFEIRLYRAIWSGDSITGYEAPIAVARSGEDGIEENVVVQGTDGMGNPIDVTLVPVTGPAIDDEGRVAFVALTNAVFEAGQFIGGTNSVYVWRPSDNARGVTSDGTLHEVARGGLNPDILADADPSDSTGGDLSIELGFFPVDPQNTGDAFSRSSFSDEGGFICVAFRDGIPNDPAAQGGVLFDPDMPEDTTDQSVRGVVMIELGEFTAMDPTCLGDCNGDGVVNFGDLTSVLFAFGDASGSPAGCDANEDGSINFGDLTATLFQFGPCP